MDHEQTETLTSQVIPTLLDVQLAKFNHQSIHAYEVMDFNPSQALSVLKSSEGRLVIGADFGGDKGITQLYVVKNQYLVPTDAYKDYVSSTHGDNYLESLEKTAAFATERGIPIGISWGAPLNGIKPLFHPKLKNFINALQDKYDGDFLNLLPTLKVCLNDAPAGLISGAIEINRSHPVSSVLFPINGSGLGLAVLRDNKIYATEAGHIEGVPELNVYHQDIPCGVFNAPYVCLERLGANKEGIEAQWKLRTGDHLRAKEIEDLYKAGDRFAGELYDHSAFVVAHMVAGGALAFGIDLSSDRSGIVAHGGAFKFPHYGERIKQILERFAGTSPALIMTKDYGHKELNACVDGAALAALIASN